MNFERGKNISKSLDLGQYRKIYIRDLFLDNLSHGYYLAKDEEEDYFVFKLDKSQFIRKTQYSSRMISVLSKFDDINQFSNFTKDQFLKGICKIGICKIVWVQKIKNYKGNLI